MKVGSDNRPPSPQPSPTRGEGEKQGAKAPSPLVGEGRGEGWAKGLVLAILLATTPAKADPEFGATWDWQLTAPRDLGVEVAVLGLDLFETSAEEVAALKARAVLPVCYISIGTLEDWRPDVAAFPAALLGKTLPDWPGERWLDLRHFSQLEEALRQRLQLCAAKGFLAVEPDNLDGFSNDSGFALTAGDTLYVLRWLRYETRQLGLKLALKNVPELAIEALPLVDFAILEQPFSEGFSSAFAAYPAAGKPVYAVEYDLGEGAFAEACAAAKALGFSLIAKTRELNAWRQGCP